MSNLDKVFAEQERRRSIRMLFQTDKAGPLIERAEQIEEAQSHRISDFCFGEFHATCAGTGEPCACSCHQEGASDV